MHLIFSIHRWRIFAFWHSEEKNDPSKKMMLVTEYRILLGRLDICIPIELRVIEHARKYPYKFDDDYVSYHAAKLEQFRMIQKHAIAFLQTIESHSWNFDFYAEYPLCMRMAEVGIAATKNHF